MAKNLSIALKYIDQLIYGKSGVVDNDGNVNLLKLGVVDVEAGVTVKMGRRGKSAEKLTWYFQSSRYLRNQKF